MQRHEQVRLLLPLSTQAIEQAIEGFKHQFRKPCYLFVKGRLLLATGERCYAPTWLPVARLDADLDLLGIGAPEICEDDEALTWVAPTPTAVLLLSTCDLAS